MDTWSRNHFWTNGSCGNFHVTHVSRNDCATNVSRIDCAQNRLRAARVWKRLRHLCLWSWGMTRGQMLSGLAGLAGMAGPRARAAYSESHTLDAKETSADSPEHEENCCPRPIGFILGTFPKSRNHANDEFSFFPKRIRKVTSPK